MRSRAYQLGSFLESPEELILRARGVPVLDWAFDLFLVLFCDEVILCSLGQPQPFHAPVLSLKWWDYRCVLPDCPGNVSVQEERRVIGTGQ